MSLKLQERPLVVLENDMRVHLWCLKMIGISFGGP